MFEKVKGRVKGVAFGVLLGVFFAVLAFTSVGCDSTYDWVRSVIDEHYYWGLPQNCKYNGSVSDFVDEYLDIYSKFYTKEEYEQLKASNSGSMSGLGVSFGFVAEGAHPSGKSGILISKVVGNSPAYRAGLSAGEFVQSGSYNGESVAFNSSAEFISFLDGIPVDSDFTLTTDIGTYKTAKSAYTASYCYMSTATSSYYIEYDGGKTSVKEKSVGKACLPQGAAYMRLSEFYGNAAYEMAELIKEFNAKNCTSLILDLRSNGGGYVSVMSDISAIYTGQLENKPANTGYAEYKDGGVEYFHSTANFSREQCLPQGVKVSVLADNGTASASEALIGVLISSGVIDYSDIYISDFGEEYLQYSGTASKNRKTYGKGIMQSTYTNFWHGYAIKLTTAKIYWQNGVCIHDVGLNESMGCKTVSAQWNVTYADEQLALAVSQIYG